MNKKNEFKKFSYVAIGKVIGAILQGVFYLIFAILLEPEAYGQMSFFIAIAATFSIISRFGLPFTLTVSLAKQNRILANQLNILLLIGAATASIILLFINIFAAFLCLALSFFVMTQHHLLGFQDYRKYLWASVIKGLLVLVIPVSLYFIFDLQGIIFGMAIGNFLVSFIWLRTLNKNVFSFKDVKDKFRVLIHNFGLDASLNLTRVVDKIVIVPIVGFAITGIYQFNLQILFIMEVLPNAIHVFLLSEESYGNSNKKIIYYGLIGSGLLSIIVIFLSPIMIELFFSKYQEGILGLQIMAIAIIPLTISAILNAKLQAIESTKVGYSAIIRIGSLLTLIFFLVEPYGLYGLGVSVLTSILLNTLFLSLIYYQRENKGGYPLVDKNGR